MNILVTGANGFLGSHIVEKALQKGHVVTAVIRKGANTANLEGITGYHTVSLDYTNLTNLKAGLSELGQQDLIIHNAGLTKSYTLDKYIKVNVDLTNRLITAIKETNSLKPEGNFAYISSLAAKGPVGHGGPASNYGISKLRAEETIKSSGLNYMIFRPTGIYGSRDVQFVPLIKAVKMGIYPAMTPKHHKMTLIHAADVAENVIECGLKHSHETVHLEDGQVYEHQDLKHILEKTLDKKTINLSLGKPIVKSLLYVSDIFDKNLNRTPKLSLEHYSEISQDWNFDFSEERKRIPLTIKYTLEEGFVSTINYYQKNNLI